MPTYVAKMITQSSEESISCGESLDRQFTKRYDVTLDLEASTSADISPLQVYETIPGLPQYGQAWVSRDGTRTEPLSIMRSWTCRRSHDNKAQFSFTFNYTPRGRADTPEQVNRNVGGGTQDLSNLLPVWSITTEDKMESPVDSDPAKHNKDLNNRRILNSAGDPFDPPPEFNRPIIVLNYSRYEVGFDGADAYDLLLNTETYKWKTNSDGFLFDLADTGFDIDKWLISNYVLTPENIGGRRVIKRDIVFKYCSRGWKDWILDAGLYEVIDDTPVHEEYEFGRGTFLIQDVGWTNKRPIYSPQTGLPVTRPWPLNGAGRMITDPRTTPVVFRDFVMKERTLYAPLGIELI